ncbi:beta-ketoacyl-[acyl-carrier-protein] synthase family protein [Ferribacterium limneticum]|uniref:beta-ketoacyl-[acyl-carrier-protein] synthase family protein n=1 Tax=Ferribacterium limneticum TaxID=76259 RepID=UPI001CFA3675|nr:beta-ketoacyl-[acyl-carrier-protein] synthase family protein [Ferribacterium limneticum]UCV28503.1 beta-ketoacyl-[acyl-carrier-protein] synthase family protein [Ferribacterium limneticum]UCV32420.1 beta-ketoacyl-[acyl-carrier-protein] synthase family protein [Ferribacterium limneticum]
MSQRRVAITGLGLVSPYGSDLADFFSRLSAGDSAVRYLLTDDQPRPLSIPFVSCPSFDPDAALGKPLASMMDRFAQLGMAAAFAAWDDCGLPRQAQDESRNDWGVAWGTALGGTLAYEKGYRELWQKGRERLSPLSVVLGMNNAANAHISIQLGLGGVSMSHTVACASSAIAIGEAFRRVRSGEATIMLTGGSDVPQAYGVARAWEALRVMAPGDADSSPSACRPFSADRRGLVLGEGGAALVLEDWEHAVARGTRIHGEIIGYGTSCDHSHLVRPEAEGQIRALQLTLADAGLNPADIDYINAHGTATTEGDPVEIAALKAVFGNHADRLAVSATKSMHGHSLGAAAAIEAIVTVLALREQTVPPTAHLEQIDPACVGVDHVTTARRGQPLRAALSNSFAFGGSNAVLAFRAVSQ